MQLFMEFPGIKIIPTTETEIKSINTYPELKKLIRLSQQ
jgi:hypothetical protein